MATSGFLKFKIGDLVCALATTHVREILPMVDLIRPPRQPRVLEGYVNLGGTAIPVLRLDRLLAVFEQPVRDTDHLILVRAGEQTVALLVERALEITAVADDRVLVGNHGRLNPCVSAEIRDERGTTHVLNLERILADVERRALDEFALAAQKQLVAVRGDAA